MANQWTGFHMIGTTAMNNLNVTLQFLLYATFQNFKVDSLSFFDFLDYIGFGFAPGLFSS